MNGPGESDVRASADSGVETRVRSSFAKQSFMKYLGAEIVGVASGRCEVRVPWKPGLGQQDGYFHAGVLGAIADSAAGYAAFTLMSASDSVLSIEYKINMLRPAAGSAVVARARVIRPGRTVTVCAAEVFVEKNGKDVPCAVAQLTMYRVPGETNPPGERRALP